jgi:hypothetical protein
MKTKTYIYVSDLVTADLKERQERGVDINAISKNGIDGYFQTLVREKGHLAPRPLKLGTVNRYVEHFVNGR